MKPILVTGATGNVGLEVVRGLLAAQAPVRAAVNDLGQARKLLGNGPEYVRFDFTDPATSPPAFEGVERMFLMRPPQISAVNKVFKPLLTAAKRSGVRQVVFLSLLGVQNNPVVPHHKIEELIVKAGLEYVFLRAGFFMQNLTTTHLRDVRNGDLFIPGGRGKTSFTDARDIAAVAVKALLEGRRNAAYDITGSEALTYAEVAEILTRVLGKPVTYSDPSPYRFGKAMRDRGTPLPHVLVMEALYTVTKLGMAGHVSDAFERLMGRKPVRMEQFARDHRDVLLGRSLVGR